MTEIFVKVGKGMVSLKPSLSSLTGNKILLVFKFENIFDTIEILKVVPEFDLQYFLYQIYNRLYFGSIAYLIKFKPFVPCVARRWVESRHAVDRREWQGKILIRSPV